MPTRKKVYFLAVLVPACVLLLMVKSSFAQDKPPGPANATIPKEPGWSDPSYRGWEILSINGLVATYYDLDRDGGLDYMVIRKIMRKVASEHLSVDQAVDIAKRDKLSVFISHPVIYFANKYPLFYCLGVDDRRNCKNIWVDVEEDGLNGNEVLYTLSAPNVLVR